MTHSIPKEALNTSIERLIREYVRLERDRDILYDHWFRGQSFQALAERHDLSVTAIKKIVYNIGDPILLMAATDSQKGGS